MKKLPKKDKVTKMKAEDTLIAEEKSIEQDVKKQENLISRLLVKTRIRNPTKKQIKSRMKNALKD